MAKQHLKIVQTKVKFGGKKKKVSVPAHTRVVNGETVHVKAYERKS